MSLKPAPRSRLRSLFLAGACASSALWLFAGHCSADVKIQFLPPPMEGTLSVGIYDESGKLVRILHKEAETDEFTVALNGLITKWDGKSDDGATCPLGKYHARGFMVGELGLEGVSFHANDWVDDEDSPRIRSVETLGAAPDGTFVLTADLPGKRDAAPSKFILETPDSAPHLVAMPAIELPESAVAVQDGKVVQKSGAEWKPLALAGLTAPTDAAAGKDGMVVVIDQGEIKLFSAKGDLLRKLPANPAEPPPVKLAVSPVSNLVLLLEKNDSLQQIRGVTIAPPETGTDGKISEPEPRVLFKKAISLSDKIEQVAPILKFPDGKPFTSSSFATLDLVPNPLMQGKRGSVRVKIVFDAAGSFIATEDGLPLFHVSDTENLKWAAMAVEPDTKTATVFESDGAAVEEYTAGNVANMMEFDAGTFQLTAASIVPSPSASSAQISGTAGSASAPAVQK